MKCCLRNFVSEYKIEMLLWRYVPSFCSWHCGLFFSHRYYRNVCLLAAFDIWFYILLYLKSLNKGQNSESYGALGSLLSLQRAIDEKFSTLEEKEKELHQLHRAVRERDRDLERVRGILSTNEATMQVRAKSAVIWYSSSTYILSPKHQPLPLFYENQGICFIRK